ncbi:MAG: hypothetical protein O2931_17900 [Planctomycetota bacterium]|nr:hypothetical protein [Planctomycetota bacterium]MDA1180655.1 hypothetical protein [Planctomycetota bacterium]
MIPRAPSQHGRSVLSHDGSQLAAAIQHSLGQQHSIEAQPRSAKVQQQIDRLSARQGLLTAAVAHTQSYRSVGLPAESAGRPIVMVGHQPQLFHPGVWFKNFVMHRLTQECGGIAVHVIIDNDLCRRPVMAVPGGKPMDFSLQQVLLDADSRSLPYESRSIIAPDIFASVADRVRTAMDQFPFEPLISEIWPDAVAAARETSRIGLATARARHQLEQRWGLRSLEVPLSHLCRQASFHEFFVDLMMRLEEVHHSYNDELSAFRVLHRIRSKMHPVPPLRRQGDWWELPFWCSTSEDPERRPLYVQRFSDSFRLSNLASSTWELFGVRDDFAAGFVRLMELQQRGLQLRPRALTTTLFLRRFLCDLFIHGIGGGSYDRLTDRWMRRLYGVEPPIYLSTTATVRLPGNENPTAVQEMKTLDRRFREFEFHPEGYVLSETDGAIAELLEQKRVCLAQISSEKSQRPAWHSRLMEINCQIRNSLGTVRRELEQRRLELERTFRRESWLSSREFAYCLFPERELQAIMHSMMAAQTMGVNKKGTVD